ncbi:MAG: hypothetical protein K8R59_14090 [Thermoanaerobaculales bacterium]|nr:hypothetical protein [Thermoanaerobaculales bacterium]
MQRLIIKTAIVLIVLLAVGQSLAMAQDAIGYQYARRPTGIRVATTSVNPQALTADVDVTVNTATGTFTTVTTTGTSPTYVYNYNSHQFPFGMLGDQARSWSGWGYATLLNPDINALEWGVGSGTVDGTTVPLIAGNPGSFRGSFTHTFPDVGTYEVQAATVSFWLFTDTPSNSYLTQVTSGVPYLIPPGATFQTYGTFWAASYIWTAPTQTYYGSPVTDSYAIGLVNSTTVVLQSAIPTVTTIGLLILAVLLGLGGVFVLRRSA